MKRLGLYIHIPFRIYKHNHRGVLSFFNKDFYIKSYFRYLRKELNLRLDREHLIDSIYIGGGDPSSMDSDFITNLLDYIYDNFNVEADCEKTIELDPQCPEIRVMRYVEHGINRFSIKAYTFDPKGLSNLDLVHDKDDINILVKTIRRYGVKNINVDMYFAYPDQSIQDLQNDIKILKKLAIPHISFYSVKKDSQVISYDDEYEAEMSDKEYMENISRLMISQGYDHYEINHYCRDERYQSIHNIKYWKLEEYLGVGLGSSGFVDKDLYKNSSDFEEYYQMLDDNKLPQVEEEHLDSKEEEKYYIINKMGMDNGINFKEFEERFGHSFKQAYKDLIDKYMLVSYVEVGASSIKFTELGMLNSSKFYMDII